eukprot:GHVS01066531.1.p1 GENE.GHVS01066531.1~~GHVS01066531.1.p1  ORF type:complete len:626 (+),score=66.98 GHVS01066531.1:167-2044(+)
MLRNSILALFLFGLLWSLPGTVEARDSEKLGQLDGLTRRLSDDPLPVLSEAVITRQREVQVAIEKAQVQKDHFSAATVFFEHIKENCDLHDEPVVVMELGGTLVESRSVALAAAAMANQESTGGPADNIWNTASHLFATNMSSDLAAVIWHLLGISGKVAVVASPNVVEETKEPSSPDIKSYKINEDVSLTGLNLAEGHYQVMMEQVLPIKWNQIRTMKKTRSNLKDSFIFPGETSGITERGPEKNLAELRMLAANRLDVVFASTEEIVQNVLRANDFDGKHPIVIMREETGDVQGHFKWSEATAVPLPKISEDTKTRQLQLQGIANCGDDGRDQFKRSTCFVERFYQLDVKYEDLRYFVFDLYGTVMDRSDPSTAGSTGALYSSTSDSVAALMWTLTEKKDCNRRIVVNCTASSDVKDWFPFMISLKWRWMLKDQHSIDDEIKRRQNILKELLLIPGVKEDGDKVADWQKPIPYFEHMYKDLVATKNSALTADFDDRADYAVSCGAAGVVYNDPAGDDDLVNNNHIPYEVSPDDSSVALANKNQESLEGVVAGREKFSDKYLVAKDTADAYAKNVLRHSIFFCDTPAMLSGVLRSDRLNGMRPYCLNGGGEGHFHWENSTAPTN